MVKNKNIAKLVILKIVCCGVLFFLLLGGFGAMVGLSTGNLVFSAVGVVIILWAIYKISLIVIEKTNNKD